MPREKVQPEPVRIVVRFPPDIHATIKRMATAEERSFNGQVVMLLRAALEARPRKRSG